MDELSALLEQVTVDGRVTNTASLRSPWGICGGGSSSAVFHLVTEGRCVLVREHQPDLWLSAGDAVFLPRGDYHVLADQCGRAAELPALREADAAVPEVVVGGEGERCGLVCGLLDLGGASDRVGDLPSLIHAPAGSGLGATIALLVQESHAKVAPGSMAILNALVRVLFLQALRHYVESAPQGSWLATLGQAGLRRAVLAVHRRPGEAWTVETLAREAGMSRSVFAETFVATAGITPAQFVVRHRMALAQTALRTTREPVGDLALRLGYTSIASFSRAFKRETGHNPRAFRARSPHRVR